MSLLKQNFYFVSAKLLAKNLLGQYLVRRIGNKELIGKIVETEAYLGPKDKAAHSYKGKVTNRNHILFSRGGHVYIYLIYGMYWQLNITAGNNNEPECVLIRALEPLYQEGDIKLIRNLANGPGKLTRWLKLNKSFYGEPVFIKEKLWIEKGERIPQSMIIRVPRIGIDYAEEWAKKKLRFYIKGNLFVSRK